MVKHDAGFTGSQDPAGDAVQEAFLRYFIERSYGRVIQNPRAWLYQLLRNYLTNRINSASAKREVAAEHIDQVPSNGHDPEMLMERSQTARERWGPCWRGCTRRSASGPRAVGARISIWPRRSATWHSS